ncbi:ABC transporter permease [Saccharopolyspora gloriosae]|uniref:ABC transporter permease n=1 Tax=Saccharopolyspora gloriosae TaxID=455344 RepID=UPI001FB80A1A|nr:ABC transporter permease [Saccharopolyspora gloriosae]
MTRTAPELVRPPAPDSDLRSRAAGEWRAGSMVWRREVLHFLRDRTRITVSLLQPLLFLYVLGIGLSRLVAGAGGGEQAAGEYMLFLFPGVLVMAAQAPAISVGASIVWDRHSGFLREMLAAPVFRSTLLLGKCLGGASVATAQGTVVLLSAGLVGVPYHPGLFAILLAELALAALAMTVLAAVVAVTIKRMQTFNTVLTVLITPLMFLSGLMFPISAMPAWMASLTLVNPLTYIVDAMRHTILDRLGEAPSSVIFAPVHWGQWEVPPAVELGLVLGFAVVALTIAAQRFARRG